MLIHNNRTITLKPIMDCIERIQYYAALAITGTWQGTSRNKLYDELGWESLSDRRWLQRLILLYKIRNRGIIFLVSVCHCIVTRLIRIMNLCVIQKIHE